MASTRSTRTRPSLMWPRMCQKRHSANTRSAAPPVSPVVVRCSTADRRLSCSSSSRSSNRACAAAAAVVSSAFGPVATANAAKAVAWRSFRAPVSPRSSSLSSAYSRIVSSIVNRTSPWRSSPMRTRLCSARRSRPPKTSSDTVVAGDPAHRLRRLDRAAAREHAEAREQPPVLGIEQVVAPVDRAAQRPLALREVAPARTTAGPAGRPGAATSRPARGAGSARRPARSPAAGRRAGARSRPPLRPFSAVSVKSGRTAIARSTNSRTAFRRP